MTAGQLDLFADLLDEETGDVVRTPAAAHQLFIGWSDNPAPAPAFHLLYHASCKTCRGWSSGGHDRENGAVEAAMDHAWPGWRTLPVVARKPHENGQQWLAKVAAVYPPGWVAAGGPVRTTRPEWGTRHYWDGSIWDIGVPVTGPHPAPNRTDTQGETDA